MEIVGLVLHTFNENYFWAMPQTYSKNCRLYHGFLTETISWHYSFMRETLYWHYSFMRETLSWHYSFMTETLSWHYRLMAETLNLPGQWWHIDSSGFVCSVRRCQACTGASGGYKNICLLRELVFLV